MTDRVMLAAVISWPFMLAAGFAFWWVHVPIWTFFVFFCIASAPGVYMAAREMWHHGWRNDR